MRESLAGFLAQMAEEGRLGGGEHSNSMAEIIEFESEDQAIPHLKRLVALKQGDEVLVKHADGTVQRMVVIGLNEDGDRLNAMFFKPGNGIGTSSVCWSGVRFPE